MNGRRFYKDKFNGKLFGVCAGIGDYLGINPLWIRLVFLFLLFFSGGLVIPVYLVIALVADSKPPHLYTDSLYRTFADTPEADKRPARKMGNYDE